MNDRRKRGLLIVLSLLLLAALALASVQFSGFVPLFGDIWLFRGTLPPTPAPPPATPSPERPGPPESRNFYINSLVGLDGNSGTSPDQPWESFEPLSSIHLQPGDAVYLARGSKWRASLLVGDSGTADKPIFLSAYGVGPRPVIEPGLEEQRPLTIAGEWIVAEDLLIRNAKPGGINITGDAAHVVIRGMEITGVGIGVEVYGSDNHITGNYIHDLTMIRNTPGGDDDYGALGVLLTSHDNEVSYNTFVRCRGSSFDYKVDGGAIELYGENVDNNLIHHNLGIWNDGFIEVGGGSARNTVVAYNTSNNSNGRFAWFNLTGRFAAEVEDFQVVNNTIVETENAVAPGILWFGSVEPTPRMMQVYNNIFYVNRIKGIANQLGFVHDHNLYFMLSAASTLGLTLGEGEQVADPQFVDPERRDFRLGPSSPAIKAGRRPDEEFALAGTVRFEDAPDLGALPYSP